MFGSSSPQAGGFSSRPADGDWNRLWVWLSQVRFGRCDYFIVIYVQRHVSINSDLHQALIWQTKGIGLPARLLQYQNEIPSTNKIQGMNGNITAVIFFFRADEVFTWNFTEVIASVDQLLHWADGRCRLYAMIVTSHGVTLYISWFVKTTKKKYFSLPKTNPRRLNASDQWALTKEGFSSIGAEQPTIAVEPPTNTHSRTYNFDQWAQ